MYDREAWLPWSSRGGGVGAEARAPGLHSEELFPCYQVFHVLRGVGEAGENSSQYVPLCLSSTPSSEGGCQGSRYKDSVTEQASLTEEGHGQVVALMILGRRPLPFTNSRETCSLEGGWNSVQWPGYSLPAERGCAQGGLWICHGTSERGGVRMGRQKMGGSLQGEEASGGAPIATIIFMFKGLSCCYTIFLKHRGTKQHQMKSAGTHLAASTKPLPCCRAFQSPFLLRR